MGCGWEEKQVYAAINIKWALKDLMHSMLNIKQNNVVL